MNTAGKVDPQTSSLLAGGSDQPKSEMTVGSTLATVEPKPLYEERYDSPERELSQGYMSDENLSDESETTAPVNSNANTTIFANKHLNLGSVRCFGFDMDYTLCEYLSPAFDALAFDLAKQFLVSRLQYDAAVLSFQYDARFPVRGVWFDKQHGNLLKVDQFGKILTCLHGFRKLNSSQVRKIYPQKIQRKDDSKIFVMNTLFNLAETNLIACLIHWMDRRKDMEATALGWAPIGSDAPEITFLSLFQDLRRAIDYIHVESMELKKRTVADLPRYVKRTDRLPLMLRKIREADRKLFLLTNSDWWYTNLIMDYLLRPWTGENESWLTWFDLTVVDGCKPRFFTPGAPSLSRVDRQTGQLTPCDRVPSQLDCMDVLSGGDHHTITTILGVEEPEVLYCGDHLYGDVIKCRKHCEWRTLLIVPELDHEMRLNLEQENMLSQLHNLEQLLAGSSSDQFDDLRQQVTKCLDKIESGFGCSGSMFRVGSKLTYFGSQLLIWADAYTGSVTNLGDYNMSQRFLPPAARLPHEMGGAVAAHPPPDSPPLM